MAAAVLLPCYKLNWVPKSYDESVLEEIKTIVVEACKKCLNLEDEISGASTPVSNTRSDDFIILNRRKTIYRSVEEELNQYLKEECKSTAILHSYLRLKKGFLRYNTNLCSSAPVERLFSTGGVILGSRRGSMSDNSFELACVLKSNPKFF